MTGQNLCKMQSQSSKKSEKGQTDTKIFENGKREIQNPISDLGILKI